MDNSHIKPCNYYVIYINKSEFDNYNSLTYGNTYLCTWHDDTHLFLRNDDGEEYLYIKTMFKDINEIRDEKIKILIND